MVIFAADNVQKLIIMKSIQSYRLLLPMILIWVMWMPVMATEPDLPREQGDTFEFSFYGETLNAASIKTVRVKSVRDDDVKEAWHKYRKRDAAPVLSSLRGLSDELGLNDWFVFELVRSYADELLGNSSPLDRVLLEHYLLVNMGYEVRLARTERQLVLLLPIEQEVYERCFVKINNKDYYLFFDDLESNEDEVSVLYPCDPSKNDVGKGQTISLLFDGSPLKIRSGEDKACELDDGRIRVSCTINEGVMKMLKDYPLMDLQSYVTSVVLPQFQDSILGQMKPQIEDMSQCEAANALLHFVQHVFAYENDQEYHGHEKVYFIEENFYYDYNDCEDRSILYAFLVRSLLGLDVQIVVYPDHECTAVRFTDCLTYGNGYYFGGEFYLICDPSYVGARIGKCMPKYRSLEPKIYVVKKSTLSDGYQSPLEPKLEKIVTVTNNPFDHLIAL